MPSSCKVANTGQFPFTEKETTNTILLTVAENSMKRKPEQWESVKNKMNIYAYDKRQ